jgi:heterodisulfide reductase subunit A
LNNSVLIIGGGIAGIKAATDLSEAGREVILTDTAVAIGGIMTQLDRTFPTNNCDLCTLSPHLSESGRQQQIELLTLTRLTGVSGAAGQFAVQLITEPRYIDLSKCTACGRCAKAFPECVRFTPGLDHRAPTCMRYPRATPYAFSIDMEKCTDVEALVKVCPTGAILSQDARKTIERTVGAIILCPGAALFDPGMLENFGKGWLPNVLTALEYEQLMSASGPTQGQLRRPSDNAQPRNVAWIQCVGSRGINRGDVTYCSSVCCMYALKEAMVTKERFGNDIEAVIFFMDMRTSGKDYERYYQRAREEFGVRFVRCRPHTVVQDSETDRLTILYAPNGNGTLQAEKFDMVVLSNGFRVTPDIVQLSELLDISLNIHQFAECDYFNPVSTSRPGIYTCGVFQSPKDIPETMVQASAAACMASLHLDRRSSVSEAREDYPLERDVTGEPPRVGVFICDCGDNIGGVIDVEDLASYARRLPQVAVAEVTGRGCSRESLEQIQKTVRNKGLNRVVIGGCSPRTHEIVFQSTLRKAGLNKYLLEIANIRDQNTWVHFNRPNAAVSKARELIRMAVTSVVKLHPLADHALPINKDVLVVGGGVTGLNASLLLAETGYKVYLVERAQELGGLVKRIRRTLRGDDVQAYMTALIEKVLNHKRIEILTRSVIVDHSGMPGMFKTGVQIGPRMYYRQVEHGATILATGALANRPSEYLLGRHHAVMTQLEMDEFLEVHADIVESWDTVVMIQCVGSRVPENPNCSRICCQAAIKNALRISKLNPNVQMFILYRDIRTLGFQEDYYRKAREKGIVFVQFEPNDPPAVEKDGEKVRITFRDHILGRKIEVTADQLVLSTGFIADDETTEDLAAIFHLQRTEDGYFLEDHVKLRPVDMSVPGFYVAGTAHSPKGIDESIAQAQAATARVQAILAKDTINIGATVARVDAEKCAACLMCVRVCPYDIPFINADGYSEIDPTKCHGCGICAAECPAKAIELMRFEDDWVLSQLEGLLKRIA